MTRVPERQSYVELMKARALGHVPEMGSARRMAEILLNLCGQTQDEFSLLDIGCAGGHYLRSIVTRAPRSINFKYTGVDVDPEMIKGATQAWEHNRSEFPNVSTSFVCCSVEDNQMATLDAADVVLSANAFMYFIRPKVALTNMLRLAKRYCLIRSYFCSDTYIVKRAQPQESHPGSDIREIDILDDNGAPTFFDHWNIYSQTYIEKLVASINEKFSVSWLEDSNYVQSMKDESDAGVIKSVGATQIWNNQEVVFPFILPWKYLLIDTSGQ